MPALRRLRRKRPGRSIDALEGAGFKGVLDDGAGCASGINSRDTVYLPDIAAANLAQSSAYSLDLDMELASAAAGQIAIAGGLGAATFVEISDWGPYAL